MRDSESCRGSSFGAVAVLQEAPTRRSETAFRRGSQFILNLVLGSRFTASVTLLTRPFFIPSSLFEPLMGDNR